MEIYKSVFLIDDDKITNYINRHLIVELGITQQIFSADNGLEGLKLISEICKPSIQNWCYLILLDYNMPVMDGLGFLFEFFKNKDLIMNCKIILVCNTVNKYDLEKVNVYNLFGVITKPLTKEKIKDVLKQVY